MNLSKIELARYSRHFPLIGKDGQEKLKNSSVLVVGAGGLGSPALLYLSAAGVGKISIIDGDNIDISNLQRQVMFNENQVGKNKAKTAVLNLEQINSSCSYNYHPFDLNTNNAKSIISNHDIVVDCTDNFTAKYLVNHFSKLLDIPLVSASIQGFQAQVSVFNYNNGPCYECLYPALPPDNFAPSCTQNGVIGSLPGIIGSIQATEVFKLILEFGDILSGSLFTFDFLNHNHSKLEIKKNLNCTKKSCSNKLNYNRNITHYEDSLEPISILELSKTLKENPSQFLLIDVRENYEREVFNIGGISIPLECLQDSINELPKGKKIVTYCQTDSRSKQAAYQLKNYFSDVKYLQGGINKWEKYFTQI